ncbi:MAG: DUF4340 domain-containing protein [Clostridia bacterium]|nr:DUF4340 domain-containing protein [Clostridia bacterium]
MKKKLITLCVLLAVLAALVGVYAAVSRIEDDSDAPITTATPQTVTVFTLNVSSMNALSYTHEGETLSFALDGNSWRWTDDTSLNLDSTKFAAMVTNMQPLTSTVKIDAPDAGMLSDFGYDMPSNTITLTDANGTHTLLIGNYNSYNNCYYAALNTTDVVYMIDAAIVESFSLGIRDLLSYDTLPAITASKLVSAKLTRGDQSRCYTQYGSGNPAWYTDSFTWFTARNSETEMPVSASAGSALSSALASLTFTECLSYYASEDAAAYGLDSPAVLEIAYRAAVETTDANGAAITVDVDRDAAILLGGVDAETGCYYATVEGSSLIYLLSGNALLGLLEPDAAPEAPLQVAPLNYDYVDKITFEAGVKRMTVSITHGAEPTYSIGGQPVEYSSLSSLFSAVSALSAESDTAESAADSAVSTTPTLRITVSFNRGAVEEGVLIVTPYNTNFDRVSFLGRDDQLISIRATEALIELIESY